MIKYRLFKTNQFKRSYKKLKLSDEEDLAMHLVKEDVNPLIIKKVLRHSSINSTMVYAKASDEDAVGVLVGL